MKKAKRIRVNAKTANKTIKKLKSKKRYYVQIRAYKTNDHKKKLWKLECKENIKNQITGRKRNEKKEVI